MYAIGSITDKIFKVDTESVAGLEPILGHYCLEDILLVTYIVDKYLTSTLFDLYIPLVQQYKKCL